MDKKLIESQLITINKIFIDIKEYSNHLNDLGLYEGRMGLCICYFILAKITNTQKYHSLAKETLTEVQESIDTVNEFGFAKGLAGIGWGVEWLAQNKLLKANTDLVLEELDDILYQSIVYSKDINISMADGATGKAMYFLYRLQSRNSNQLRYKMICNLECLTLLSDEISDTLLDTNVGKLVKIHDISESQLLEIAQALILMLRINEKKINTQIAFEAIKAIVVFSENVFLNHKAKGGHGFLHLAYAYLLVRETLHKENFTKNSIYVNKYLDSLAYTKKTIVDQIIKKRIHGFENKSDASNYQSGNHFLSMLKKINSVSETTYGYEAMMLK